MLNQAAASGIGNGCDENDKTANGKPLVYDRLEESVEVRAESVTFCLRLSDVMRGSIDRKISGESVKDEEPVRLAVAFDSVNQQSTLGGRVFVNISKEYDKPLTRKSPFYLGSFVWSQQGPGFDDKLEEFYLAPFPALRKLAKEKQLQPNKWLRLTIEPIVEKKVKPSDELKFRVVGAELTQARPRIGD